MKAKLIRIKVDNIQKLFIKYTYHPNNIISFIIIHLLSKL